MSLYDVSQALYHKVQWSLAHERDLSEERRMELVKTLEQQREAIDSFYRALKKSSLDMSRILSWAGFVVKTSSGHLFTVDGVSVENDGTLSFVLIKDHDDYQPLRGDSQPYLTVMPANEIEGAIESEVERYRREMKELGATERSRRLEGLKDGQAVESSQSWDDYSSRSGGGELGSVR